MERWMGRVRTVAKSKWLVVVAGIWIQCTSGSSYTFGVYSETVKSKLGYDQSTLDTIASFKDIGANVGVLSGLLYGISSPWVVLLAGAVQNCLGYGMMWLSVTGRIAPPAVWQMCFYMFLAAHAQTFFNTAVVVTSVNNFPTSRGTVVGLMKNVLTLGTSSNLIICIFLFVILLFPMAIAIKSELWHSSIIPHYSEPLLIQENHPREEIQKPRVPERTTGVEILNVDFQDETDSASKQSIHLLHGSSVYSKIPEDENAGASAQPLSNDLMSSALDRGDNFNLFQAMRTLDFWILFLSMACGMGSGLTTINNMSQIGSSLDYTSTEIDTLVSLWSIWNFLGRFGAGYVSETFLHSKGYARPLFIAIALLVMSGGHLVIASGLPGALYAGSVLIGVCYGSQWSLMPATTSEIFGLQHFGTLFNTIAIASPIGSYILSVKVVGYLYDYEAEKEHHLENTHTIDLILSSEETCDGSHCFRVAFMIMCAVSLLGWFVASVLFLRTRRFYKQVIFERIHRSNCQ